MSNALSSLENLLLKKWDEKTLPHFYVLTANDLVADKNLYVHQFLMSFFSKLLGYKEMKLDAVRSHPDFFFLGDEKTDSNYKMEELAELMQFNELAPMSLKHKFIVIYQAHLLSIPIYNKLLKLLEEPNRRTTIFLLNPRGIELMATIKSRALGLKLPYEQTQVLENKDEIYDQELKNLQTKKVSLAQLLEKFKAQENSPDDELAIALLQSVLKENANGAQYLHYNELLEILKFQTLSQAYRNSVTQRLFHLLAYAQE